MGEVAEQVGRFVNAYSGDLQGRDARRAARRRRRDRDRRSGSSSRSARSRWRSSRSRTSRGRSRSSSSRGCSRRRGPLLRDGAILLIAGRVDHKGEEVSLLADLVADWDDAAARGPEAFARDVAAGDRGGRQRFVPANAGRGRPGCRSPRSRRTPAVRARPPPRRSVAARRERARPARPPDAMPQISPAEPVPTYLAAPGRPRPRSKTTDRRSRPCRMRRGRGSSATRQPMPRSRPVLEPSCTSASKAAPAPIGWCARWRP